MLVPPEAYILAATIALVCAGPFVARLARPSVLSPIVWIVLAYTISFVVRPLYILLRPGEAHPYVGHDVAFPQLVVGGLALALAGIVVLWVGFLWRAGEGVSRSIPLWPQEISPARWRQAVLALFLLGVVGWVLLIRQAGGFSALIAMLATRAEFYESDELGGGLKMIARCSGIAAVLGIHHHLTMKRVWWAWPLVIASTLMVGTTGGRGAVIMQIWLVTYALFALHRPRYASWRFVSVLLLGLAFAATAALAARRATARGPGAVLGALREVPGEFSEAAMEEARGFDYLTATLHASGRAIAPQEGATYAPLVLLLVPRFVRPYQPVSAGMLLREVIEPTGIGGRPSTAMGEGYMNFGLAGALAAMFLVGVWCRVVQGYGSRALGRSRIAPVLYAYALAGVPHFMLGVAPLAIRGFAATLLPVLIAFLWSARVTPVGSVASPAPHGRPAGAG